MLLIATFITDFYVYEGLTVAFGLSFDTASTAEILHLDIFA